MTLKELERRFSNYQPGIQGIERKYAVLVPVVEQDGGLHLLFEVRADTLKRQPGEVCFPGGRMEPGEGPKACALRETEEEMGIPAEAIRTLAHLDVLCHQSGFLVHPVLGVVEKEAVRQRRPSPAEVKDTFLVPLEFFRTHPPQHYTYEMIPQVGEDFPYEAVGFTRGYTWSRGRVDVPIYQWQGRAVWGLTGRIVDQLIRRLEA